MKPVQVAFVLAVLAFALFAYFIAEVMLFRFCCVLARVPRPGIGRSALVVLVILGAVFFSEGILGAIVRVVYERGGFPLWEAGLVGFFIGLPIHMLVCSVLHAKITGVPVGDSLAVWFVEKTIKFLFALAVVALVALILFSR